MLQQRASIEAELLYTFVYTLFQNILRCSSTSSRSVKTWGNLIELVHALASCSAGLESKQETQTAKLRTATVSFVGAVSSHYLFSLASCKTLLGTRTSLQTSSNAAVHLCPSSRRGRGSQTHEPATGAMSSFVFSFVRIMFLLDDLPFDQCWRGSSTKWLTIVGCNMVLPRPHHDHKFCIQATTILLFMVLTFVWKARRSQHAFVRGSGNGEHAGRGISTS